MIVPSPHKIRALIGRLSNGALDAAIDAVFGLVMRRSWHQLWPAVNAAAGDPQRAQDEVLRRILSENAQTGFGREHGFGSLSTAAQFREAVPTQTWDSLQERIDRQERTGEKTLTSAPPVLYAQTSGTSGSPKFIPITQHGVDRLARAQRLFTSALHAETSMFSGKLVGIGSPAVEGHLPGGNPFGSASGLVYEGMPSLVRRKYAIGPEALAIEDHELRYHVIAAHCIAERDVSGVATANPSTLLRLRGVINDEWDDLVSAVQHGRFVPRIDSQLSSEERVAFSAKLPPRPGRARSLRQLRVLHGDNLGYGHLWPQLAVIATWTGGSCGFAIDALRPYLAPDTVVAEIGYSASEVRGAVGMDPHTNQCLPMFEDTWFEFVPREVRDAGGALASTDFLGLHQLEVGGQYYVWITTADGLYRYDMNDIVEVTSLWQQTPCIAFVQKGRGVTNITGEKLSESQVLDAVSSSAQALGIVARFFVMLADEAESRYVLCVERDGGGDRQQDTVDELVAAVDGSLIASNVEYASKRQSGRLHAPIAVDLIQGTGDDYRRSRVDAGQRDAQFKYLHVQLLKECEFDFLAVARGETA